ncbi:MAG: HD domain-containing protein, partial [Chloroflexota bacterium]
MQLAQQIAFLREIDKLKTVIRQTHIADESRQENTAEHSWH